MNSKGKITAVLKKELLSTMIKIRTAEEKIVEVYPEQQMRTPTHLSIGQEAVATGVAAALNNDDQIFAGHRCHAAYLAKGGQLDAFFSELCGRSTGSNAGRGGSAHLADSKLGFYASPILGAMIPVAVGAGLSFKMDRSKRIAVTFFGDAALEEGVFSESLNFAVIKKLPVLFICENNLYSTHTHIKDRQPRSPIYKRVSIPELKASQCDGNDVEMVYKTAVTAVNACRGGNGPVFLEFLTYRYREHVGPLYDYDKGYRTKSEVERWQKRCPIKQYAQKLIRQNTVTKQEINNLQQQSIEQATQAYEKALKSPWPQPQSMLKQVY